jgi:hypothetical protein
MTSQQKQESKQQYRILATTRIPAATGTAALNKGHQQEMATSTAKRQQKQDLCGRAIKVEGNEARNMSVNMAVIKKSSWQ